MSPSPVISVIVPVYNAEKTLRKCVESICNSDYPHLEIICINDGSTDSSPSILRELAAADPRIIVVNQENGGLSAARNAGLDIASGRFVTGVDADDFIAPDLYTQAVPRFSEDTDIVTFGVTEEYDPPESRLARKMYEDEPFEGYRDSTEQVILNMHPMFCTRLWRRTVIERHHIRFHLNILHEDVDFFMKVVVHCRKIYFLKHRGYHYLQHAASIMGKQLGGHASFENVMAVEHSLYRHYHERGVWEQHRHLFAHMLVRHAASSRYYFATLTPAQVQEAYYRLSVSLGLQAEMPDDFPLQTLKPVTGWKKLFLTHLPNTSVYRILGFPLIYRRYEYGRIRWGIVPWLHNLAKRIRRLRKRSMP